MEGLADRPLPVDAVSGADPVVNLLKGTSLTKLGTLRFLVVEDDPTQLQMLRELFNNANVKNAGVVYFDVKMVTTAEEALSVLQQLEPNASQSAPFDLILLDVMLPDVNAYDVLPSIRELVGDNVAIVIASAHSQLALVQLCVRRGADAFLVKPLGSPAVQHLWQFVKDLPANLSDDSFKRHMRAHSAGLVGKESPCGGEPRRQPEDEAASESTVQAVQLEEEEQPQQYPVPPVAAEIKPPDCGESVLVCAGCLSTSSAASSSVVHAGAFGASTTSQTANKREPSVSPKLPADDSTIQTVLGQLGSQDLRPGAAIEDAFPSLGKPLLGGQQQQQKQQHGRGVPRRTSGEGSEKSTSSAGGASASNPTALDLEEREVMADCKQQ